MAVSYKKGRARDRIFAVRRWLMISVVGATGNVGAELVELLCKEGAPVRVLTRSADKAARLSARVDVVVGDIRDEGARRRLLAGATRLFCFPFVEEPLLHDAIVDDARRAGIRHVVALSSIGAATEIPIGRRHREREEAIERSSLPWTFLRPSYFASNALRWAPSIKAEGQVVSPVPDRKADAIAPRDIAEVAKLALVQPGHEGKIYVLTGAELLTVREQVDILARVLGKPITCFEVSIDAAIAPLHAMGRPDWLIESLVAMWTSLRAGAADPRTDTFATLVGRPPEGFESWATAHRNAFV
jgi:uncharacterized protein YbjT (DUF2867 family)